jgi:inner membrane protein YidH
VEPSPHPSPADASNRFRDHAANERTVLAWIRTGIAMMGFGFAIARFGLYLKETAHADPAQARVHVRLGSEWFGVVILGLVTNGIATFRYDRARRSIEAGRPMIATPFVVYALGAGSILVALAMAVMLSRALGE